MNTHDDRYEALTEEELQAIRARCAKATPGPWWWHQNCASGGGEPLWEEDRDLRRHVNSDGTTNVVFLMADWGNVLYFDEGQLPGWADATFIACARQDVPRLLAEVERLRAENARLRAQAGAAEG